MKPETKGLRFQPKGDGTPTKWLPQHPNGQRNQDPTGKNKKKPSSRVATLQCAFTVPLVLLAFAQSFHLGSPTSDIQSLIRGVGTEWTMESTCKGHSVWENDIFWREAALKPTLCDTSDDLARQMLAKSRIAYLRNSTNYLADQALAKSRLGIEHLRDSIHLRSPCGAYCVFHTDSLATRRRGLVSGWALINPSNNGTRGCWNPVFDMKGDECFQWFEEWKSWMKDKKHEVPEPPCSECDAERANAIQLISMNVGRRCKHESCWKKNASWRMSVEDPALCQKPGGAKPDESLNLGEHDLFESLAMRTPCGSLCVFHSQSVPGEGVSGFNETKVAKKGWKLVDINGTKNAKGCFEPIEDVRTSNCRLLYHSWGLWMKTSKP
jgi:hypothetical protein